MINSLKITSWLTDKVSSIHHSTGNSVAQGIVKNDTSVMYV